MKGFWTTKRIVLGIIFVIGLFFVLFVGRTFNSETFQRNWILTTKGVFDFRKGLDISGGTKLIYKIDYKKYKELYSAAEFALVKKNIEDIILKNIDSRISGLGVSDYVAKIQTIGEETQVVVEIGGVADLDQAKEIIGKTVELEFRIQNEDMVTPETIAQRKQMAEKARADALLNPEKMVELYANHAGENIIAQTLSGTLSQLPEIYTKNANLLNTIPLNQISELIEGNYHTNMSQNASGELESQEMNGFLTFRVRERSTESRTNFSANDVISAAEAQGLTTTTKTEKADQDIETNSYRLAGNTLLYNAGELIAKDQVAYDVRVLAFTKPTTIGKSEEETAQINKDFETTLANAQATLQNDPEAEIADAQELANSFVEASQLKELIPDFDPSLNTAKTYTSELGATYLVYAKAAKEAGESAYSFIEVAGISNPEAFENSLKNQTLYVIDEIFVQDRLTWKLAQGNDGSPLNGAYFTLARAETTQFGEPSVGIEFNGQGKDLFCEITSNNIGKSMGIFIGGVPATIATIQTKICDGRAQISGGFDKERALSTAKELNSGNMPAPLILLQEEKVSPSLGDSAFQGALIATLVGVFAIILYVFFIYGRRKAVVTALTMIFFFTILLAFLKLIDYALSLSGIAAIILSIGMAVDANILIFERMNEEVKEGKSYLSAIQSAVKRSWSAIRDGQISTLLIGVLLFAFGISMFKGFGSMIILTALLTLILNVPFIKEALEAIYKGKKD